MFLRCLISEAGLDQLARLSPGGLISCTALADAFGFLRLRLPHLLAEAGYVLAELVVDDIFVVVVHFGVTEVVVVGHLANVAELAARRPRHVDLGLGREVLRGGGAVGHFEGVHVVEHLHVGGVALDLDLVLSQQKSRREMVVIVIECGRGLDGDEVDLPRAVLGRLHVGWCEINSHLLRVGSVDAAHGKQVLVAVRQKAGICGLLAVHSY